MLKKTELSERLKKLKIHGVTLEQRPKEEEKSPETKETSPPEKKEIELPKKEPVLRAKKTDEISEKKPEEFLENLDVEKREIKYIKELTLPEEKLSRLFKIETSYTEDTLTQVLTAWRDSEKSVKWTVTRDKHGEEFYSLKSEGLVKMKDDPPIYGLEFDSGALIATHMGEYTFIMGCYNFDVKTLVKVFAVGLENARRYNL